MPSGNRGESVQVFTEQGGAGGIAFSIIGGEGVDEEFPVGGCDFGLQFPVGGTEVDDEAAMEIVKGSRDFFIQREGGTGEEEKKRD